MALLLFCYRVRSLSLSAAVRGKNVSTFDITMYLPFMYMWKLLILDCRYVVTLSGDWKERERKRYICRQHTATNNNDDDDDDDDDDNDDDDDDDGRRTTTTDDDDQRRATTSDDDQHWNTCSTNTLRGTTHRNTNT